MSIQKHIVTGYTNPKLVIWAETANINYFITTPLQPVSQTGATDKQVTFGASTARQYPGDPTPVSRSGGVRTFIHDPGRRSGNALPGKKFWLVSDAGLPGEERRQFTFQGNLTDLHAWLTGHAKMQIDLYGPSGARYTIPAKAGTP